jgi:hypothetical protein
LRYETADDAIIIARRAIFVIAALAGFVFVAGVMVMGAMTGGSMSLASVPLSGGVPLLTRVAVPHAAKRAGQDVADGYDPGGSAMVPTRDHDALGLQMQLSCMIISRRRPQGQCRLR